MADNISVTQGFGTIMSTDEIGGVHFPRNKIVFGADGAQVDVSSAAPLPVTMGGAFDDLATEATLTSIDGKIDALATEETLTSIDGKFDALATEATLASISGAIGGFATEATLTSIDGKFDALATEATLTSIDGKFDALATEATLTSIDGKIDALATEATLTSIDGKFDALATEATLASISGAIGGFATEATLLSVDGNLSPRQPGVARQLAASAASANTALTSSVRRISIYAVAADIRYSVGVGSQTAAATSHFIAQNERLTVAIPASAQIAVIRAGSTDGTLELTELS